jgi:hypothetical protein
MNAKLKRIANAARLPDKINHRKDLGRLTSVSPAQSNQTIVVAARGYGVFKVPKNKVSEGTKGHQLMARRAIFSVATRRPSA